MLGTGVSAILLPVVDKVRLRMRWLRVGVLAVLMICGMALGQEVTPKPRVGEGGAPAVSEKQKKLLEDMEKLVQMTAELKVSVDKSTKNELSLDVVRKAEAVEKLAKSVKERIREAH